MNGNCPDPAVVTPSPEGDYVCNRIMSEEEAMAAFWHGRCEMEGKVSTLIPVNEHLEPACIAPAEVTVKQAFALFMSKQCLYMYSDNGLCYDGIPSGISSKIISPDLPQGIELDRNILVRSGDSLSRIANRIYGTPSTWSKLYNANKSAIGSNPDLIVTGQILKVP